MDNNYESTADNSQMPYVANNEVYQQPDNTYYQNQEYANSGVTQQYQYGQSPYEQSDYLNTQQKSKRLISIDIKSLVKIMYIVAAMLMLMAPGMTLSKINVGDMTIKLSMYEMLDMGKVMEKNEVVSTMAGFYTNNYTDFIDMLEEVEKYTSASEEVISTLNEYAPILVCLPVIGPCVQAIVDMGTDAIEVIVDEISVRVSNIITILKSDTNHQIVDTISIATSNRQKVLTMTIILIVIGIAGIIFTLIDLNIAVTLLSAVGIFVTIILVRMFEHVFLSMGSGVYFVAIASILYLVFGIVGCVQKRKNRA